MNNINNCSYLTSGTMWLTASLNKFPWYSKHGMHSACTTIGLWTSQVMVSHGWVIATIVYSLGKQKTSVCGEEHWLPSIGSAPTKINTIKCILGVEPIYAVGANYTQSGLYLRTSGFPIIPLHLKVPYQ